MIVVTSIHKVPLRISQERWSPIAKRHPETVTEKEKVIETVTYPDLLQEGDFGEILAVRFYPAPPLTKKYLIVAYREISEQDGFILTAYFTNLPSKRRRVLWKR